MHVAAWVTLDIEMENGIIKTVADIVVLACYPQVHIHVQVYMYLNMYVYMLLIINTAKNWWIQGTKSILHAAQDYNYTPHMRW